MSEFKVGQTKEYLEGKAKERGVRLVLPLKTELMVDLDGPMEVNNLVVGVLNNHGLILSRLDTVSPGGNRHIYFQTTLWMEDGARVAMQAALGSDPVREMLSALDLTCEVPVALFETEVEYQRVVKWRVDREGVEDGSIF